MYSWEPTIAINAPQLEVGHFLLSDSCSIDFNGSTFLSTIKELLVSTSCYSLTTLGSPMMMTQASGTCWMYQTFLTAYSEVEKAVITVTLTYPEWQQIEGQSDSGESSDKSIDDAEDKDGSDYDETMDKCYLQGA
ncbi:hypothetical protein L208DRAFT_1404977 [Tricholoma matsutake]|nr:hypothetical protein L208DRAFT_1404977 [Tricholoma matsutake 945]